VANAGASLLRGFPVSSSATRTSIAIAAGSRTQVYSLAAAGSALGVLLFLRPVLSRFPTAALGAIVIYAAIRLVDVAGFRRLLAFRRGEFLIAVSTCVGVLAFNILYGVLVAIGISVADLLVRVGRPHDAILGRVPGLVGMHNVDDYPRAQTIPGLVVYRYDAPGRGPRPFHGPKGRARAVRSRYDDIAIHGRSPRSASTFGRRAERCQRHFDRAGQSPWPRGGAAGRPPGPPGRWPGCRGPCSLSRG
jgi:Sulfate permease family